MSSADLHDHRLWNCLSYTHEKLPSSILSVPPPTVTKTGRFLGGYPDTQAHTPILSNDNSIENKHTQSMNAGSRTHSLHKNAEDIRYFISYAFHRPLEKRWKREWQWSSVCFPEKAISGLLVLYSTPQRRTKRDNRRNWRQVRELVEIFVRWTRNWKRPAVNVFVGTGKTYVEWSRIHKAWTWPPTLRGLPLWAVPHNVRTI